MGCSRPPRLWRENHFVVESSADLPTARKDDRLYLYVALFAERAKVGVSGHLAQRMEAHEKVAGEIEAAYFVDLERSEAFRREALIANAFGDRCPRGKRSEWFAREHAAIAVLALREPEALRILDEAEEMRRRFAGGYRDCRFQLIWIGRGRQPQHREAA